MVGVIKYLRDQLKTETYFFKIFLSSNHEIKNLPTMLTSIRINKAFQTKSPPKKLPLPYHLYKLPKVNVHE